MVAPVVQIVCFHSLTVVAITPNVMIPGILSSGVLPQVIILKIVYGEIVSQMVSEYDIKLS